MLQAWRPGHRASRTQDEKPAPPKCTWPSSSYPAVQGMCRKHAEEGHTIPKRTCRTTTARFLGIAPACGRTSTLEAENFYPCHVLGCKARVDADYCGNHNSRRNWRGPIEPNGSTGWPW